MRFLDRIMDTFRDKDDICPNCQRPWKESYRDDICGNCQYQEKIIVCPVCFNIIDPFYGIYHPVISKLLCKPTILQFTKSQYESQYRRLDCKCCVPYIRLNITNTECREVENQIIKGMEDSNDELNVRRLMEHAVHRHIFEHYFGNSQIDRNNPGFQEHYAYMYPETDESKAWFAKHGTTYEEKFYPKYYETEVLTYEPKQFTIPTPTGPVTLTLPPKYKYADVKLPSTTNVPRCPICGSTSLSKISNLTKAAKISAFGIYGAGDVGKTYKCNHCGVKF